MQQKAKACIYFAIGTMSGSSLDGLDITYCCYQKKHIEPNKWDHSIIMGETMAFPEELLERIKSAHEMKVDEFFKLDADLGRWMG